MGINVTTKDSENGSNLTSSSIALHDIVDSFRHTSSCQQFTQQNRRGRGEGGRPKTVYFSKFQIIVTYL